MDIVTLGAAKSAIKTAVSGLYKPAGSTAFADLPTPAVGNLGYTYIVTDAFTSDSRFTDYDAETQTGHNYPADTEVTVVITGTTENPVYKFDALGGIMDGYATKAEVAAIINDAAASAASTYSSDKINTLLAPPFSTEETYIVGDIVTYQNKTYQCKVSVTTAGAWDSFNWEETTLSVIDDTKAEMSAIAPEWSPYMAYKAGDYVTYKGRLLQAKDDLSPADNIDYDWSKENSTSSNPWVQHNAINSIVVMSSEEDIKNIPYPYGSIIIIDDERTTIYNNTAKTKRTNYVVVNGVGPEWKNAQGAIAATISVNYSYPNAVTFLKFGFVFTLAAVEGVENCVDANEKLTVEKVDGVYTAAYPNTDIKTSTSTAISGRFSKAVAKTAASNPLFVRAWVAYLDENNEEKIEYSESAVYVWKEDQ